MMALKNLEELKKEALELLGGNCYAEITIAFSNPVTVICIISVVEDNENLEQLWIQIKSCPYTENRGITYPFWLTLKNINSIKEYKL